MKKGAYVVALKTDGIDTGWKTFAMCTPLTAPLFFADQERSNEGKLRVAEARRICMDCAVRKECRAFAVDAGIDDGVWGGMDPGQRRGWVRLGKPDF
jgi:WhiB family redox-sensing transcriptional regulator